MKKERRPIQITHMLKSAGISATGRRLAVLNILDQASRPLSVGDIRKRLDPASSVNKVTVYRIISLLKKQGIVREISTANGFQYFEMATSDHPTHPHFNCTSCKTVSCLTPLNFSQMRRILSNPPDDFSIDHIDINISGLCNGCLCTTKSRNQPLKKGHK